MQALKSRSEGKTCTIRGTHQAVLLALTFLLDIDVLA